MATPFRRRAAYLSAAGLGGGLALILLSVLRDSPSDPAAGERLVTEARAALGEQQYDLAEQLAARIDRRDEAWAEGRVVAGEAAQRAGRFEAALEHYRAVPRDGSETAILAAYSFAEVCRHLGRLSDAEQAYAWVLAEQPDHPHAHERMAFLLGVTGRRWESLPHYMSLVRTGNWSLDALVLLGDPERSMDQSEYVERCVQNAPADVLVQLAAAARDVADSRPAAARPRLEELVARAPHLIAAQTMLGEILIDADEHAFLAWHAGLPLAADESPDTWYLRGLWARRHGNLRAAARCFWEAVRRAPAHRRANYQLGQVLISLEQTSGQEFAERARQLDRLTRELLAVLRARGRDELALRRVVELMEETGRLWEAWAWATTASRLFPSSGWPRLAVARLGPRLQETTPAIMDSANLALRYDLSGYRDHEELFGRSQPPGDRAARLRRVESSIRFVEEADGAGIDFVYYSSPDPSTPGVRMFEVNGGGVAVLDYDGDGWPDLYFTQGAEWPHGAPAPTFSARYTNRLYRNAGGAFEDVTAETGLGDRGYGQGCAVGDFDNDGFPDVYVANVGRNRLYRNNGDGTFSDVTDGSGLSGEDWTASCVVVDLNGDGHPDLYDVNYLEGDRLYEILCAGRACSPRLFGGAPDRLYLSRGDGTFEPVALPPAAAHGKGLGVVAAVLDGSGRPSLFVANDQVPNLLLRSEPSASGDPHGFRIRDDAFASGLAYNGHGLAMAGMGIAAEDVDGDGQLDFFVTNFKTESNTLYLQQAPGIFIDGTNAAGLRAPSLPFVGWGTQFLDADRDGEPDLVVTNGHVDDYPDEDGDYHMRPQFFRNAGGGRFVELQPAEAGDFFERKYLGRGLARLDWNRDGLMDFVVSHIGDRAALVTNRSADVGRFLNVRLRATKTARDAIGSTVEVVTADRRWSKQLVAGDGYMASNERVLQFGLGQAASVSFLRVRWPSGGETMIHDPPLDATIEMVEGLARVWRNCDR